MNPKKYLGELTQKQAVKLSPIIRTFSDEHPSANCWGNGSFDIDDMLRWLAEHKTPLNSETLWLAYKNLEFDGLPLTGQQRWNVRTMSADYKEQIREMAEAQIFYDDQPAWTDFNDERGVLMLKIYCYENFGRITAVNLARSFEALLQLGAFVPPEETVKKHTPPRTTPSVVLNFKKDTPPEISRLRHMSIEELREQYHASRLKHARNEQNAATQTGGDPRGAIADGSRVLDSGRDIVK